MGGGVTLAERCQLARADEQVQGVLPLDDERTLRPELLRLARAGIGGVA
jgi:hypothetical protein